METEDAQRIERAIVERATGESWQGVDLYGDRVFAVRGKDGSAIVVRRNDPADECSETSVSISAASCASLAAWLERSKP